MRTLKEQVPLEERRQRTEPWSLHHEEEKTSQKPEGDQLVRWRGCHVWKACRVHQLSHHCSWLPREKFLEDSELWSVPLE